MHRTQLSPTWQQEHSKPCTLVAMTQPLDMASLRLSASTTTCDELVADLVSFGCRPAVTLNICEE